MISVDHGCADGNIGEAALETHHTVVAEPCPWLPIMSDAFCDACLQYLRIQEPVDDGTCRKHSIRHESVPD